MLFRSLMGVAAFGVLAARMWALDPPALRVAVAPREIRFQWKPVPGAEFVVREIPLHTNATQSAPGREVWRGAGVAGTSSIERLEGTRDRLFAKFSLCEAATGEPLGPPQHVTDFSALAPRTGSLGSTVNKKGLTCVVDPLDALAVGIAQVAENIDLGGLLDWQSPVPALSFEYEGRKIGLHAGTVERLDEKLRAWHAAKVRVTGILLSYVRPTTPRSSPLVHPLTDPAQVPAGPAAFNTATPDGIFYYRALLHWLVDRYTRDDAAHGHLGGLVIGNEVQSHWTWYHLGFVEPEMLLREYSAALRVADLATRSVHADFPIYVSLEHHWMLPASDDPRQGLTGVEVLEGLNAAAQREGNFPWHLAHHPYPENLGEPRFWNDASTPLRLDAPRLTFQNLEVLPAFMRQPRFLFEGRVRRIALTEQGFHRPDGDDGEALQAAAYAFAWKKVQALPEIEAFLYHRHVDHPHEFGLRCGLREHDGSAKVTGVGHARKIWEVVQKAGTPDEDEAFAFALPIIGRPDWQKVVAESLEPVRATRPVEDVIFDFVARRVEARQENLQSLEFKQIGPPDEVPLRALQQHPQPQGIGTLRYRVLLPQVASGRKLVLAFEALLNHAQSSGASFAVRVDGRDVFARKLHGAERVPAEVQLVDGDSRHVEIEFAVEALADPAFDWATWIAPRILRR